MEAQVVTSHAQSSARLGRSAWVVLLAGLFGSAFVTAATLVAGGLDSRRAGVELLPAYGVTVGVLIASYGWSLMLAARALKRGENSRLPMRLINFSLFPLAAYAIAHWFPLPLHPLLNCPWFTAAYFPVLIPFLALAIPTGTILVPKVMRRIETRHTRKNLAPWTAKRRRVTSTLIMLVWLLLLGAVLIPAPLFVYGLAFRRHEFLSDTIFKHTPDVYRDLAEWALQPINVRRFHNGHIFQLSRGYASIGRLRQRATDANPKISDPALHGLFERDPRAAVDIAVKYVAASVSGSRSGPSDDMLQCTIGRHGTAQQQKDLILFADKNAWQLRQGFFTELAHHPADPELISLLEARLRGAKIYSQIWALTPLMRWLPEAQAEAWLKRIVDSNDPIARDFVLERGWFFTNQDQLSSKIFLYSVEHKNILVRKKAWNEFWLGNPAASTQRDCVRGLLRIMGGDDSVQRRAAAQRLVRGLCIDELMALEASVSFRRIRDPYTPLDPTQPVESGGAPEPESPDEAEALQSIRAAAENG